MDTIRLKPCFLAALFARCAQWCKWDDAPPKKTYHRSKTDSATFRERGSPTGNWSYLGGPGAQLQPDGFASLYSKRLWRCQEKLMRGKRNMLRMRGLRGIRPNWENMIPHLPSPCITG